jgi:hypothetical protein
MSACGGSAAIDSRYQSGSARYSSSVRSTGRRGPIESEAGAVENGALVDAGDCEHEWGSELDAEEAA